MEKSAPDDFGAYYDPARKTRQVWRLEKMEQLAQSQAGSNSASFFLYRRAKFIEQDRENRMQKEEDERKRKVEAGQKAALNKAETDKKLLKNQMKRLKKKQRHENYEKRLRGEVTEPPKKMVRNESAVKAVAASIESMQTNLKESV
jgi:hypothetical protein